MADRLIWTGRFRFERIDLSLDSSKDASEDSWDPGCVQVKFNFTSMPLDVPCIQLAVFCASYLH